MNVSTTTTTSVRSSSSLVTAVLAAVIGLGIVFTSGFVQADTLHAAAHDVRHATGFPCH
ncbi:CbtB domain-containing protein [Thalassococcus sp. BH17M4-6]|uniref:CbtB domain-containing protein n=1 Tax=Thalassococcus sp. BH17M4-6 TaxID=3413148 RepID=UPI003BE4A7D9